MEDNNIPEPPPAPPPELEEFIPVAARPEAVRRGRALPLAEWRALLYNRFILGGLGVLAVLFVVMIVLVVFGGGDGGPSRSAAVGQDSTPDGESTPVPRSGLVGNVRTTTTMRNGPGSTYAILGTIRRGALVSIIGRNADDTWLQVLHPPGSQIHGWVDASFIEVSGDLSDLAIAGPGSGPAVVVPTSAVPWVPQPTAPAPTDPSASPTSTPPPSPSPPTLTPPTTATVTPPPLPTEAPSVTATAQATLEPQSRPTETRPPPTGTPMPIATEQQAPAE
jgi:uncharacterized protein YraI